MEERQAAVSLCQRLTSCDYVSPGSTGPMSTCGRGRWLMPWWTSLGAWQKGGA